ncbi:hypothetical protein [Flavobacterium limnophilum]|uniref:hypothetical protein n=1 Tax=Flavobacterium limnophilum TaxID=3003262 RepID=UPI00248269A2|nr:hypothetical protein [Flavobacterium limnophilum]
MQLLKINLHGESWTLNKLECSADDLSACKQVAATMKVPLAKALIDPFFYYYLKIPRIPSVEYLPGKKWSGLLDSPKNQIEILLDGKKIQKLQIQDLNQGQLLFPLYAVHKTEITENYGPGIYVEQKAIGFIGNHEIKVEDFSIDDLQFHLLQFNNKLLLQRPAYQNKKVISRRKETLLIYQNSFEI